MKDIVFNRRHDKIPTFSEQLINMRL